MATRSRHTGTLFTGLGLGLAAGVAFGTLMLAPNLSDGATQSNASAVKELETLKLENAINEAEAKTADSYIGSIAGDTVADVLKDKPVVVLHTADAVAEDIDAIEALLRRAGAIDAGKIALTEKFFAQDSADRLKSIIATTLPAGAQLSVDQLDPGTHAGEALAAALLLPKGEDKEPVTRVDDRNLLLNALRGDGTAGQGFIDFAPGTIQPAQLAIIITGDNDGADASEAFAAQNLASFAMAMDKSSHGAVLAGRIGSAAQTGAIGVVRNDAKGGLAVSTVDSISYEYARMATVLTAREQLDGGSGAYGAAASAEAASPARPRNP